MDVLDRQSSFSGTKAATGALALPIEHLDLWLSGHVAQFSGLRSANQFKGGQSNPTYHLIADSGSYVLRRKPPGKLLTSAHAIDREYKLLTALAGQHFPAARPLVYCDDDSVIGTPFYVMTHIEGRVIWEPSMPESTPVERRAVFKNMSQTLARLHSFDPQSIGLGDFGKADGYIMRQVRRWSENFRLSATEDIDDMNRLIAWLPSNLPQSARAAIVHGDYRLDNLILAPDAPDILAVLDWELATLGDPIADLVYHLMTWVMPRADNGGGTGSLLGLDYATLGLPTMQEHAADYAEAAGLDTIPDLEAYLAYNFFRLAAILQGIVGRVRDGTASNDNAQAMANQVRPLAQAGWLWAQKAPSR